MADNKKKALQVKTGDRVMVIAGKDKGKIGNVKKAIPSESKVICFYCIKGCIRHKYIYADREI